MKVVFEVINERSGANVWTERLCLALHRNDVACSINHHPVIYQFVPIKFNYLFQRFDNVIQHGNTWNGWAFKTDNPLVVTEHTAIHDSSINIYRTAAQGIYYKIIKKNEARSLESADYVTCVSQYAQKILEQTFDYTDSHVIPNGVDTNIFQPLNSEGEFPDVDHTKTIILFVGNLTRLKGADLLPQIMDLLGDRYTLLVTSGFKHNVDIFQKNIVNIGLLDQKSLVNAYNLCDIFLLPSRLEGMSLSTLEAMACAKPIVAFNCSSFPELVVDGKGGFLLEKEDVNGIVERIRYLAQEPDLIRRMGMFNRERVLEKFTLENMTREYIRVYKSF